MEMNITKCSIWELNTIKQHTLTTVLDFLLEVAEKIESVSSNWYHYSLDDSYFHISCNGIF